MFGINKSLIKNRQEHESNQLAIHTFPVKQTNSTSPTTSRLYGNNHKFSSAAQVLGRFQLIKEQLPYHPHLANYVLAQKSSRGSILVASEHFNQSLQQILLDSPENKVTDIPVLAKWTSEIVLALHHLHRHGMIHRNLNLDNIQLDSTGRIKLTDYGIFFMTQSGKYVKFPIGNPCYFPPEVIVLGPVDGNDLCSEKTDVWMIGRCLLDLLGGSEAFQIDTSTAESCLNFSLQIADTLKTLDVPDVELGSFIRGSLEFDPNKRLSVASLLEHPFISKFVSQSVSINIPRPAVQSPKNTSLPWDQLLSFWKLSTGTSLESLLSTSSHLQATQQPIVSFPTFMLSTDKVEEKILSSQIGILEYSSLYELAHIVDLEVILFKLSDAENMEPSGIKYVDDWKIVHDWRETQLDRLFKSEASTYRTMTHLSSKENDFSYQVKRIQLFQKLLLQYPLSKQELLKESIKDIPPMMRNRVWAALLDASGDAELLYERLDKDLPSDIDRQLDLDIPRCHQYNELLSSPVGHQKLRRVIKAWALSESDHLVYWQGIDSLAAIFVTLNFYDEALAFASMSAFTKYFCQGFYIPDNSKVMREYVLAFRCILSFHEPLLSAHLHSIGLGPELYAIPWFMTSFAHIFSLDKVYLLWDQLLTHPSRFFLMFVATSILSQIKDSLLNQDFNHAMLLFSELPPLDFEQCIADAIQYSKMTPPSMLHHLVSWNTFTATPTNFEPELPDALKRFSFLSSKRGLVGSVSVQEAKEMKPFTVFVDLREIQFFHAAHIPHSIWAQKTSRDFFQSLQDALKGKYFVVLTPPTSSVDKVDAPVEAFAAQCVSEGIQHVLVLESGTESTIERISNGLSCSRCLLTNTGALSAVLTCQSTAK